MNNDVVRVPVPKGTRTMPIGRVYDQGPTFQGKPAWKFQIGTDAKDGWMTPLDRYFVYYGEEWKQLHPEQAGRASSPSLQAGRFILNLGIGNRTGLYPLLCSTLSPKTGNLVMDCAMAAASHPADGGQNLEENLRESVLFSGQPYPPQEVQEILSRDLNRESREELYRKWTEQVTTRQGKFVTLAADLVKAPLASCQEGELASFYTVTAFVNGTPLFCMTDPDAKNVGEAVEHACEKTGALGLTVFQVSLDSSLCTKEELASLQLPWQVKLSEDSLVLSALTLSRAKEVRWKPDLEMDRDTLFGAVYSGENVPEAWDCMNCLGLFFDGIEGERQRFASTRELYAAARETRNARAKGLKPKQRDDVVIALANAGWSAIACSRRRTAREMLADVRRVQPWTDQMQGLKQELQQGGYTLEDVSNSMLVRMFASVFVQESSLACRALDLDICSTLESLSSLRLHFGESYFMWDRLWTEEQQKLLAYFDLEEENLMNLSVSASLAVAPKEALEQGRSRMRRCVITKYHISREDGQPESPQEEETESAQEEETESPQKETKGSGRHRRVRSVLYWEQDVSRRMAFGELTAEECETLKRPQNRRRYQDQAPSVPIKTHKGPLKSSKVIAWEQRLDELVRSGELSLEDAEIMRKPMNRKRYWDQEFPSRKPRAPRRRKEAETTGEDPRN